VDWRRLTLGAARLFSQKRGRTCSLARDRTGHRLGVDGALVILPFHLRSRGSSPLAMFEEIGVRHNDARKGISHAMQLLSELIRRDISCALRSMAEVGLSARTREGGHCANAGGLSAVLPLATIHDRLTWR
jgi:hypothetical protein